MPWQLVVKNLLAHPVRTLLTLGAIAVAIFLVVFLGALITGLSAGVDASSANRLIVQSAVSLFVELPLSYQAKIEAVPGVERACKLQWFGGYYQEQSNFFAQFGVDAEHLLAAYPEIELIEGTEEDFLARRTACLIGEKLATRFGWKVGDRVPLIGTIFRRTDGETWTFDVVGIYRSSAANVDEMTMWFRYDYLEEVLETGGAQGPRGVGVFVLNIAPGADPVAISADVDSRFAGGPQRVQTTTEAEFQRQFVSMLGNIPRFLTSIGGGVLFAIMLAVLNTMLMSARQRTRDFGILKALGFTDATAFGLLLAEALTLALAGGGLGVAVAVGSAPVLREGLATIMPAFAIGPENIAWGLGMAVVVGLLGGIGPAWQVARLKPVVAIGTEE